MEHAGPGILPAETVPRLREDPGGGHQLQVQGLRGLRQGPDGRLRHPRRILCSGTRWYESCGYRVLQIRDVFIPDPDLYLSRISDPGSKNSTKRGGGNFFKVLPFCVAPNIIKL
jgi:hypothetical protein